ncbi:Cof-type HAD-IIB family hydrolase [Brevibacillus fulvus]|uniref:Cof subfamily protein (Haloacid dehalogenase superfamily) n=1 Tax=Brevibacillus fulvus TaxID=1125967 RepID=A0A938Y1D9_9BACL|nr:Cof-type HAD-IIB family hydrolase [Brevibacillus fulvus]MBM7591530.1 Cof subfamily protein (haloacid dehalogenase superfamily) [Brevibacillus fulvus]
MKLIAIDLDGTLLSENGTISQTNREAIVEAQRLGHIVAICTGRALQDAQHILQQSGLDCPIMAGNGAVTFHGGKLIEKKTLPADVVSEILTMLFQEDIYAELYTNEHIVIQQDGKAQLRDEIGKLAERDDSFPREWALEQCNIQFAQYGIQWVAEIRDKQLADSGIYKIFAFSFDRRKLQTMRQKLEERTDISLTTSGWTKLEIAHPAASKGNALVHLARLLHISPAETVAIGDNYNDLSMFQAAGTSIAMGNAAAEIKQHCTYTTLSCGEDGVAYGLRKYILNK